LWTLAVFGSVACRNRLALMTVAALASLITFAVLFGGLVSTASMIESMTIFSIIAIVLLFTVHQLERAEREAFFERHRSEELLHNILPVSIASRLKEDQGILADRHEEVTVLFADIVGFTPLSASLSPERLVSILDTLFVAFDDIAFSEGLEKIKTIGDAYMAAAGLPEAVPDHAARAARAALRMRDFTRQFQPSETATLDIRIGLRSGPVVAGVIGQSKFAYDLWGDTVNTASRMESSGAAGTIQASASTAALLPTFRLRSRGEIAVKGKGKLEIFVLEGDGSEPS